MCDKIGLMISTTEENYLKAIYKLMERDHKSASTNAISKIMKTSAASVTDMVKRLAQKKLIQYKPYKGAILTAEGVDKATTLIRKHRLWEVFLCDKLGFDWNEVHDIAEELEHISSAELVKRLDEYLGYPKFDPHGDPIPSEDGTFTLRQQSILSTLQPGEQGTLIGVRQHDNAFLSFLDQIKLNIGTHIKVLEKIEYDNSIKVMIKGKEQHLSDRVVKQLYIKETK